MSARFYGGSLDGRMREVTTGARRVVVAADDRTRETYARDHEMDGYDVDAPFRKIFAYKLELTERCVRHEEHDIGTCRYEVVL